MRPETCSFVVGMDPGTTFSGVTIAQVASDRPPIVHKAWEDAPVMFKFPTNVAPFQMIFKWPATQLSLRTLNEKNLFIIRKFKLLMQLGAATFGDRVRDEAVYWCITIPAGVLGCRSSISASSTPAIWSDVAKRDMSIAASIAGIIPEDDLASSHMKLILEPEAAALHIMEDLPADFKLKDGDIYMIVDAGGGTVDIVVHRIRIINGERKVEELTRGSGNLYGATKPDELFEEKTGSERSKKAPNKVLKTNEAYREWLFPVFKDITPPHGG
ncbi:hypothetical protein BDK51DRAFT_28183 [Blyttiomyces helicus]|uniref:Heat shock protein 70 family n=1 Tax=Blyttiomyces helicus TaxID=388810 RepID=A0A4P9W3G4_9FUNG|nr:hypothetical protein BDK51DRAFT_28183 [Blyttiomyces helicus]|eukprot:RKO85793.1 hypothetical protein BDK51DRAFT_28183 [Blyttiomyces helicus]